MNLALTVGLAYLMGSIPTSHVAAKYGAGIDLRQHGSKNLGATNLYRVLGWRYAIPVGLFDTAKGFVPTYFFAPWVGAADWVPLAIGFGAIVGHVFPMFLKFAGGKGVATATGALLAVAPTPTLVATAVWGVMMFVTGIVSVASITAALVLPITVWALMLQHTTLLYASVAIAFFIVFNHRTNIRRIVDGVEPRFGRHERGA